MKRILLGLVGLWSLFAVQTWAGDANTEIQHLLVYIKTTPCQYERNGLKYKGSEAVVHVQRKYDYFKDKIKTAEDFVRLCATKSELTGQTYQVQCPNEAKQTSAVWLLTELKKFRKL